MVAIRSTHGIEAPLAAGGKLLVSSEVSKHFKFLPFFLLFEIMHLKSCISYLNFF